MDSRILKRAPYRWELLAHGHGWMVLLQYAAAWVHVLVQHPNSYGPGELEPDDPFYLEPFSIPRCDAIDWSDVAAHYPFTGDPVTPVTLTPPCPHWIDRDDGHCGDDCADGRCPSARGEMQTEAR